MKSWEQSLIAKLERNGRNQANGNIGIPAGSALHLASMAYDDLQELRQCTRELIERCLCCSNAMREGRNNCDRCIKVLAILNPRSTTEKTR